MSTYKLKATDISEYVRYQSCERRFKLKLNKYELAKKLPKSISNLIFSTSLDPVLEVEGRKREDEWEKSLQKKFKPIISNEEVNEKENFISTEWSNFVAGLERISSCENYYAREVSITGDLGQFTVSGQIDFVTVFWEKGEPKLRLVECKASRKDRTYHQVQIGLYRLIVRQLIKSKPVTINGVSLKCNNIEAVVVRIDESNNESQDIITSEPLSLDTIEADIHRLTDSDGLLKHIIDRDLNDLDYQLDQKCSDCVLSVHCLTESARQRRLELLGVDSSIVKSLRKVGVHNLDDLAIMDLTGWQANQLQHDISFTENLELLQLKAKTRRRTLPGGNLNIDTYEVEQFPNYSGGSQLPEHIINGKRLIRVYLSVEYDYVENRIGALAAHVTKSEGKLDTKFQQNEDGKWDPDPQVKEYVEEIHQNGERNYLEKPLEGENVIKFKTSSWTGDYKEDNGSEKELIQGFLLELVDAIDSVAKTEEAPIHFYVWSRQEMTQLVEGCSRVSSQLLSNLRDLLGCRESLEQLIYSCLSDEVDRRYALGWTGRDLAVVSSLKWFGRRYHWQRKIAGKTVRLDSIFFQDVFDFKSYLNIDSDGQWSDSNDQDTKKHPFEVRVRYFNSLSAAYWRAYWRTLPSPDNLKNQPNTQKGIENYNKAQKPNYLKEYFLARTHAVRWIEEGIRFKNPAIKKEPLVIADLPDFNLDTNDVAQAGIDFLRLDHHIKLSNWIANQLIPPIYRISSGRTIPVKNIRSDSQKQLTAEFDFDRFNIRRDILQANCTIDVDSFIRLSPSSEDIRKGQTIPQVLKAGRTCVVKKIDWELGIIKLDVIGGSKLSRYQLSSLPSKENQNIYDYATIDESPSDFVAGRVDKTLESSKQHHVYQWLDPKKPQIPLKSDIPENTLKEYQVLLKTLPLPNHKKLDDKQIEAAINGLKATIQLLQGPPGTGKTETTAIATFLRILERGTIGDIILIAAHTHTAVNNLLLRLDSLLACLQKRATELNLHTPSIQLSRVDTRDDKMFQETQIETFSSSSCFRKINKMQKDSVLVIGGTTNAILKMVKELNSKSSFQKLYPQGFQTKSLIVDEASMMVFPHFLALATLVKSDGEMMLSGDHRQLAPIITHDWENEDRPPVLLYQPYVSAYQAIRNIKFNSDVEIPDQAILCSALTFTFRLPTVVRELIGRLYHKDNIDLQGIERSINPKEVIGNWERLLQGNGGLFLVIHDERESKRSNALEVKLVKKILDSGGNLVDHSTAILTPHRAQRSLLKTELADYYENAVDVIDTVEKVQGGECDNVIVSATASDLSAISKNVDFILGLNRSNVAFSRVKKCLIVVCAKTLLDYIPKEIENYEEAILWKALRSKCSQLIFSDAFDGHRVQVFTPPES
jgi:hypothetical protein